MPGAGCSFTARPQFGVNLTLNRMNALPRCHLQAADGVEVEEELGSGVGSSCPDASWDVLMKESERPAILLKVGCPGQNVRLVCGKVWKLNGN